MSNQLNVITINNLRKERASKIEALENKLQSINNNSMYSDSHKNEQAGLIKSDIQAIKNEYEPKINELIETYEHELIRGYNQAEYKGLEGNAATIELLKELRVQREYSKLIEMYRGNVQKDELRSKAFDMVEANSPLAKAYFDAMKTLNVFGYHDLEEEYNNSNMNDLQKEYKGNINELEEIKQAYNKEVNGDPFENVLLKYQ